MFVFGVIGVRRCEPIGGQLGESIAHRTYKLAVFDLVCEYRPEAVQFGIGERVVEGVGEVVEGARFGVAQVELNAACAGPDHRVPKVSLLKESIGHFEVKWS